MTKAYKAKFLLAAVAITGIAFSVSACSFGNTSAGSEIKQTDATQKIVIGKTTKQQVYLDFGEPTKVVDNGSTFFYSWTKGSKFSFMGMGSTNAVGNSLVIIFDNEGVVRDYRITRGAVDNTAIN